MDVGFENGRGRRDSNSQPSVLETAALPIELLPYIDGFSKSAALHLCQTEGSNRFILPNSPVRRLGFATPGARRGATLFWCRRLDSNQCSAGLQPAALPTELPRQIGLLQDEPIGNSVKCRCVHRAGILRTRFHLKRPHRRSRCGVDYLWGRQPVSQSHRIQVEIVH